MQRERAGVYLDGYELGRVWEGGAEGSIPIDHDTGIAGTEWVREVRINVALDEVAFCRPRHVCWRIGLLYFVQSGRRDEVGMGLVSVYSKCFLRLIYFSILPYYPLNNIRVDSAQVEYAAE